MKVDLDAAATKPPGWDPNGAPDRIGAMTDLVIYELHVRDFSRDDATVPAEHRGKYLAFTDTQSNGMRHLRAQMPRWRSAYPGVEAMNVAVMGCVVNGPGESKHANIGISLPGSGEAPVAPVFVDGERTVTLKGERIAEEFQAIVDDYVARKYGAHA